MIVIGMKSKSTMVMMLLVMGDNPIVMVCHLCRLLSVLMFPDVQFFLKTLHICLPVEEVKLCPDLFNIFLELP